MKINLPDFKKARVLVVGDVMLDRYWHGGTSRISPEAPVPVVKVGAEEHRAGGAGNVALNIAALGGQVTLMGLVGDDERGEELEKLLTQSGVECVFKKVPGYPTITKLRIISRQQQLIRLDFEEGFESADLKSFGNRFEALLNGHDVVIFSDYGKGALREVPRLIHKARAAEKVILVDPKGNDFSKYAGASLITPNNSEFEAVVGPCGSTAEIVQKGNELVAQHQLGGLLVTRGEAGMSLLRDGEPPEHMPTRAREVFDVTGAGDTVIATLAAAIAAGADWVTATQTANLAAGVVVGKLGTATAHPAEIRRAMHELENLNQDIVTEEQLKLLLEDARSQGEKIVFTNGCFDLLHAGHVQYLQQARQLGDRLVVAINSDESVRRLKGPSRPVNQLAHRMAVLAALKSVDWVVAFEEETPARIIENLLPDVLVKGGDYEADKIVGGEAVKSHGGEVCVLPFLEGTSTTRMIDTILNKGSGA